jgi:glycosyltransferase involved in cell wall biosynthesis
VRVSIIAPGLWHAPEVADALRGLGHSIEIVGAGLRHKMLDKPLRLIAGAAGRVPACAPPVHAGLGALAHLVEPKGADLVICWSSFALASEIRSKAPLVLVRGSHHIRTQRALLAGGPRRARPARLMVRLEEAEYRRASTITVPTNEIASDSHWRSHGKSPVVTPYGFPATVSHLAAPSSKQQGLRVIFGGAVSYRKGIDRLVEVLQDRPPWVKSFDLFGGLAPGAAASELPTWWAVHAAVSHRTWIHALRNADVLVLPSREEGMARVGQEAMACGVPVVATPESGLGQWLAQGAGLELPASDWNAGFAGILETIRNEWRDYSQRATEVAGSWTWRDHASLLLTQARVG